MSKRVKAVGFVALTIAMFMGMLDNTIVNIALPDITNYFHSGLNDTSWITTIYVMGIAIFSITAAKLGDQFGRKKLMIIGLILFGGSSALCGLTKTLSSLILCRLLQSIGGAIVTPLVIPMGLEIFGKEKMQMVAGGVGAIAGVAAASGPPIGGLLIKYINWQSIFFVNVPFAILSLILIILFVGESYDHTVSKSIDWLGMLFLTATLFLLTFALLKGNDYGWGSALIVFMFIGSAACFLLFIFTESKVKSPMVELRLFRESTFSMSSLCNLIAGFGTACPILIFSYFLQNALGYEALKAATIVMTVSLTIIVAMPLGAVIASKFGARPVNFLGILCMSGGIFMLSRLKVDTARPTMILDLVICGFGLGFASQAMISAVKYLPKEKSGIGSGVVNAARQIGLCLGIAILVSFLDGNVTSAKDSIRVNAIASVQKSDIVSSVKAVMVKDIGDSLSTGSQSGNSQQTNLQSKLKSDIQSSISAVSSVPRPSDPTLAKAYDAASALGGGASKASDGQKALNGGIRSLDSGLSALYDGSRALTSGATALKHGASQLNAGSQKLSSGMQKLNSLSTGLQSLSGGASALSSGLGELFRQFNPGSVSQLTLRDKVDSLSSGTQSYVGTSSAIMDALRGNSSVYSGVYGSLTSVLTTTPNNTSGIKDLATTLVLITDSGNQAQLKETVGILGAMGKTADASYITAQQAEYDNGGAALSSAASALDQQMKAGGGSSRTLYDKISELNSGAARIESGANQLVSGTSQLDKLQSGFDTLVTAMNQLESGSFQLVSGAQRLQNGLSSAKSGAGKLADGSVQLEDAAGKISDGASKLTSGIGLAGQKGDIGDVVNKIKTDKDSKVAGAFDKTFLLAAVILLAVSVCGLFTDKKEENPAA